MATTVRAAAEVQGAMNTAEGEEITSRDGDLTGGKRGSRGIMLALGGGRAGKSQHEDREVLGTALLLPPERSHCCSSARGSF